MTPMHGQLKAIHGLYILPNGKFGNTEWNDASVFDVKEKLKIFLKKDSIYIYIGLQFIDTMHTGIDLYLADTSGFRKKLHVSSAIGEMDFKDGTWSDWRWGANDLWTANTIGQIIEDNKQKVVPLEGFEFQINKSILNGSKWFAYFHLKRPEFKYPENALEENVGTWFIIEL
jgi:hypothetical protein